jgi:outer membrane protein
MRKLQIFVIAFIAFIGTQFANAQAKTAHVDLKEIMTKMPAYLNAQKELETLGKKYNEEYVKMVGEYQAKLKKYEDEGNTQTDAVNQTRQQEMQDMGKRIQDFQETAQKEVQKKESDLMKPLEDKIRTSIQKVGRAKGYQYILENSALLLADGPDITPDVKKDLGF